MKPRTAQIRMTKAERQAMRDGRSRRNRVIGMDPTTMQSGESIVNEGIGMVSHAQNPSVLRRARDFYAVYCASSDGKNYQGLPCPDWDALTPAVRGHWYTVALRSLQLEATADPQGVAADGGSLGNEKAHMPSDYVLGHLTDPEHALTVWSTYSEEA